jgi:peptidoglycan/xylan/chitin deacetylase (PgdA/CDA1 family)
VRQTSTPEERSATHTALIEYLYPASWEGQADIIRRLVTWSGVTVAPRDSHRPMMTDELKKLSRLPQHSVGAHTIHHPCLPFQQADAQLTEIAESKRCLESVLGLPVRSFSYPYGEHTGGVVRLVRESGFDTAVSVESRAVRSGTNPLLLPRIEIKGCDVAAFARTIDHYSTRSGKAL